MKILHLAPLALISSALSAGGSILMLDFGSTEVTGDTRLNSPYHTAAGAGFTDVGWNRVERADVSTGLVYSNGTAATGITMNLGVAPASGATTLVALGSVPGSSSGLGTVVSTGIYASPSVGRDGIFGVAGQSLGVQVTGLAPGIYEIFIIGRNTNISNSIAKSYVGTGVAGVDFDFSGLTPVTINYTNLTSTSSWIEGVNYSRHTITLGAGDGLNIATQGTDSDSQFRGFLNSIQIVQQVPEPSTAAFLSTLLLFALRRGRACPSLCR